MVGAVLALAGVCGLGAFALSADYRSSQFGRDTTRASVIMGLVGAWLLWSAWLRFR